MTTAAHAQTFLFVPGDRPDRFSKGAAAGADVVVLDLEDAVATRDKEEARRHVVRWLSSTNGSSAVRINAFGTPWHEADLAALTGLPVILMVPKSEDPERVGAIAASWPGTEVVALIETARGVLRAAQIAEVPGVKRLALGTFDLAAELGVDPEDESAMAAARAGVVLASAAAKLNGPVDGVTSDVRNTNKLIADVRRAATLGFKGKLCVHPAQVTPAATVFAPTEQELAWARRIMEATSTAAVGVLLVDGQMVDRPVIDRAARILASRVPVTQPSTSTPAGGGQ
ncbi:CoA ester lyase (plasmid) [Arthrobacter sp. Z1-9]